jgi:glycosyltransferase involved in cell wall biosynthesis
METTKREYLEQKHTELFNTLGCFRAFNNQQFAEGLEKAGGIEKTGKYVALGAGLYCPKKHVDDLLNGMDLIKKNWENDRKKVDQVKLIFVGIDSWNRPVWKAPDIKAYYGSVNELFDYGDTEETVLKKIDTFGLCYFGDSFGCEPMGSSIPDKYYI